jgi:hypothetical protein
MFVGSLFALYMRIVRYFNNPLRTNAFSCTFFQKRHMCYPDCWALINYKEKQERRDMILEGSASATGRPLELSN